MELPAEVLFQGPSYVVIPNAVGNLSGCSTAAQQILLRRLADQDDSNVELLKQPFGPGVPYFY